MTPIQISDPNRTFKATNFPLVMDYYPNLKLKHIVGSVLNGTNLREFWDKIMLVF